MQFLQNQDLASFQDTKITTFFHFLFFHSKRDIQIDISTIMDIKLFYTIAILATICTGTAFAQSSLISTQTDKQNYDEGDTIVISGQVATIIGDTQVTLQLFKDGNLVEIAQVAVSADGNYSHTLIAEGPQWNNPGIYSVKTVYGEGNIAETEFKFTPESLILETTSNYEVKAGSSGTFDIPYTMRGGIVEDISIEPKIFGLILKIEATDNGVLTLDLPRDYIDAEKQNGKDEVFIILIEKQNGEIIETTYDESVSNSNIRTITINFEEGDSEIQIIGTYVIPEFGTIVMIVLTIGIMASILLTRNRFQIKI